MNVTRLPPGVAFERETPVDGIINFRLKYKTKNVDNPEQDIVIHLTRALDTSMYSESLLPDIVADMLKELYIHEVKEWLTIGNKHWREPHP